MKIKKVFPVLFALGLSTVATLPLSAKATGGNVEINKTNFPDDNFRAYIEEYIDVDGDKSLSKEECMNTTYLNVPWNGINSLKGIEHFVNLQELDCSSNNITELDVSMFPELKVLSCSRNKIKELDLSSNPLLYDLSCFTNEIEYLDLSHSEVWERVSCERNKLVSVDISHTDMDLLYDFTYDRNERTINVAADGTFDLSTLKGFNVDKAYDWNGATVKGNILTCTSDVVTYKYSVGTNLGATYNYTHVLEDGSELEETLDSVFTLNCVRAECTKHKNTEKKITKATFEKNGSAKTYCKDCGKLIKKSTIYKMGTPKLSATTYTYNGDVRRPSVTVKNANGTVLKKDTHYTVSYASGRKNVGTYKVTIKGKGNYSGTVTKTFKINPPKTAISKLTASKKAFTVEWKKKTTQTSGYQVKYSLKKDFSGAKTKTYKDNTTTKKKISDLKAGKKYYVKIRTYKKVGEKNYYSGWSKVKTITTKK